MALITPTFTQIKAMATAIRQKASKSKSNLNIIGIHTKGQWTGDRQYSDGALTYHIRPCISLLAIRMAIQEHCADSDNAVTIILTPLEDNKLEEDIRCRLAKRTIHPVKSWQIAKSLFQANTIDPRLYKHEWIADYLLDWSQTESYPAVTGGFLDAETVWPILLKRGFGLTAARPDLISILQWSVHPDNIQQFQTAPTTFRQRAIDDWLINLAGAAVKPIFASILHTTQPEVLPLGLVAEVLYHPEAQGKVDKAIGKMEERFLGGTSPDPAIMQKWTDGAIAALQDPQMNMAQRHPAIQRADEILAELGVDSFAHLSSVTELGFQQRLSAFGRALAQFLDTQNPSALEQLQNAHQRVKTHWQSHQDQASSQRQLSRTDMALRLARWLQHRQDHPTPPPQSLENAILHQTQDGSFLDWARLSLRNGDPVQELSQAYSALFDTVQAIREDHAHQFALLLQNWVDVGTTQNNIQPVETILERIVAPIAAHSPILLIVMDGMGTAVCRELLEDMERDGWSPLKPNNYPAALQAGLASIPSITQISRTSLLCGQLCQGGQSPEKTGFAKHPALLKHCKKKYPPLLFHKAALQDNQDTGLAEEVRDAIENSSNQVVGVILNAVDDHLSKGEQVDVQWNRGTIKGLTPLLQEAKLSKRLVILLSDHGHLLEHHSTYQKAKEGEQRWRPDDGAPNELELQIKGDRILKPDGQALIAPWSGKLRYGSKRNGYHGGISPQEMVIPIAVLAHSEPWPGDWIKASSDTPLWWEQPGNSSIVKPRSENPGSSSIEPI